MTQIRPFATAFALALSIPAHAGETADWRAVNASTAEIRDIEGLEQLARDFPDSGSVRLRLLQPYVEADEIEKVMATLEWLYDRGYVFSDVVQTQIPKLLVGVDPGRIAERLRAEPEVIIGSEVVGEAPAVVGLAESVFVEGGSLLVTSVSGNSIHLFVPDTGWTQYFIAAANDLSGIVGEANDSIGWVASSNLDNSDDGEDLFTGLIGLQYPFDDPVRIPAPAGAAVSDLSIGTDGTVYASDPLNGGVYRKRRNADALETLVAPGIIRSAQGSALSADGARLYVSDYRYGIAIVDLETKEVSRLSTELPILLDGVDGMWRHGNELIAVQNGTSPMRISAFELSEDGSSVIGHRVLEQAHPEWTEPLGGSISGESLVYVGNGQWDKFVSGELGEGKTLDPTQIRRLPLD
ncbi:MAG: hypothetical protein AAGK02_13360 [Pseudomonadota bacterium]